MSSVYYMLFMAVCFVGFGDFFLSVFEKKQICIKRWEHILIYLGCTGCILAGTVWLADAYIVRQIVTLGVMWGYSRLLYREKSGKPLLWILLYYATVAITEFLCMVLFQWLVPDMVQQNSGDGDTLSQWIMAILVQLILFLIIIILRGIFKRQRNIRLTVSEWIRFALFAIFSVGIISTIYIRFEVIRQEKLEGVYLWVSLGLLLMNILIYTLICDISRRDAQIQEDSLLRERAEQEMKMYRSISESYEKQQRREHEYKNQLACIGALLRDKNYEEAEAYLLDITHDHAGSEHIIDTNHVIVNAILNSKYKEARDKGILMTVLLSDLSKIKIADKDIVIILSNLLNNAIEACEQCERGVIKVKIAEEEQQLLIAVSNTYQRPLVQEGEVFRTTKTQNSENHGLGLENVRAVVDTYNGICVVQYDAEEFRVLIQI